MSLNSDKARQELSWKNIYNVDETIKVAYEWYNCFIDDKNIYNMSLMQFNKYMELVNEKISVSYAQTVYGKKEINAVIKCLNESTQMGYYARTFEKEIAKFLTKSMAYSSILVLRLCILEWKLLDLKRVEK